MPRSDLNSLNAAVETIAQLSTLFRLAIDRKGVPEIPLEEELDFIRRYLDIERVRFGEKLGLEYAIEPDALPGTRPGIPYLYYEGCQISRGGRRPATRRCPASAARSRQPGSARHGWPATVNPNRRWRARCPS